MPTKLVPDRPDLGQYKKQAKDLVKACSASVLDALNRIRLHHPRFRDLADAEILRASVKLADAQFTVAREHGFETWSQFSKHVDSLCSDALSQRIPADGVELAADISDCEGTAGLILFAHASGSGRYNARHRYIVQEFRRNGLCTVHADLMTEDEELADGADELRLDVRRLGVRMAAITDWIGRQPKLQKLRVGYLGSGISVAAAMFAAAQRRSRVQAVVSASGRPDLSGPWMWNVQAPVLFVVGSKDIVTLGFTSSFVAPLPNVADRTLAVIEGAHQLFEEETALQRTTSLARDWFRRYLGGQAQGGMRHES